MMKDGFVDLVDENTPLQELDLSGSDVSDESAASLGMFTHLQVLDLSGTKMSGE